MIRCFWFCLFCAESWFASSAVAADFVNTELYSLLRGVAISNSSNSSSLTTNSASVCALTCTARSCAAAQYDTVTGLCTMAFGCATISLYYDNTKQTVISSNNVDLSAVPIPMFDWMMTDVCGINNTGWFSPGLGMNPSNGPTTPWNAPYSLPVGGEFGNAIDYLSTYGYMSLSSRTTLSLDMSKSLTLFAFVRLYATPSAFPFLEFQAGLTYQNVYGPHFWFNAGGLYYNFEYISYTGGGCVIFLPNYSPPLNVWTHYALVYDGNAKVFTGYLNGELIWTGVTTTYLQNYTVNYILTGSRGSGSVLPGSTYCLKVFKAALNSSSLNAVASSCTKRSIRFT